MEPKTTLVPGVPWPTEYDKTEAKKPKKRKPVPKLAFSSNVLDIFAEAREQIASGAARRKTSTPTKHG